MTKETTGDKANSKDEQNDAPPSAVGWELVDGEVKLTLERTSEGLSVTVSDIRDGGESVVHSVVESVEFPGSSQKWGTFRNKSLRQSWVQSLTGKVA